MLPLRASSTIYISHSICRNVSYDKPTTIAVLLEHGGSSVPEPEEGQSPLPLAVAA